MTRPPIDRREFFRRAGLTAGAVGVAGGMSVLPGCSDSTTDPRPPLAPTALTAVPHSAARIDLAWADNATDEASYEVERRLASEAEFTPLATLTFNQVSYSDEAVVERTMYIYRVRAVAERLTSDYSNEADATTPAAGAPLAPLMLAVESVTADGAVLTWTDIAVNENGYRVERVDEAGTVAILSLPEGASSARIEGFATDDLVRIRVVAVNEIGDSPPSGEVRFFTGAVAEAITLTPIEPGKLRVSWTDRSLGRVGFELERDSGQGYTPIATLPAGTALFDDTTFPLGVTCTYRVSASDAASIDQPTASIAIPTTPPPAPMITAATHLSTNGSRVVLDWQLPEGADVLGSLIERRIGTGSFSQVVILDDPKLLSFQDDPNAVFSRVAYRVTARRDINWNLAGNSPPSTEAVITPRAVFFLTGNLAVLGTVNKGAAVTISRPAVTVGASCNATTTSIYLVRESTTTMAAVVAHCTHECLRPPSFNWAEASTRFRCAHGSEFNLQGQVLHGPASRDVATLETLLFDDRVELIPPTPAG